MSIVTDNMFQSNQCEGFVGLGFMKGLLFYKKSFNYPSSFLTLLPEYPREDLATLNKISVTFSRDIFSPGDNLFSYSLTCRLFINKYTQLIQKRLNRMFFLLFLEVRLVSYVFLYVCFEVHMCKVDLGGNCDLPIRNLYQSDQQIFVP